MPKGGHYRTAVLPFAAIALVLNISQRALASCPTAVYLYYTPDADSVVAVEEYMGVFAKLSGAIGNTREIWVNENGWYLFCVERCEDWEADGMHVPIWAVGEDYSIGDPSAHMIRSQNSIHVPNECPMDAGNEWFRRLDSGSWAQDVYTTMYQNPPSTKAWPFGSGWCSGSHVADAGTSRTVVDCWDACEAIHGRALLAVDWWWQNDMCYCQTECTCMMDADGQDGHLLTRDSLLDLPEKCTPMLVPASSPVDCPTAVELSGTTADYGGMFVKTNMEQSGRPIYSNSGGYFLYFWDEFGSWRVGVNYSDATCNIDSGSGVYADCPPDTSQWYEWLLNAWRQRVTATLYDHAPGTVEWLPGEGICQSDSFVQGTAAHVAECWDWCSDETVAVNWDRSSSACYCRSECQCVDEVGASNQYTLMSNTLTRPSLCGATPSPTASPTAGLHNCPQTVVLSGMTVWFPGELTFVKNGMVQYSRPVYVSHILDEPYAAGDDPVYDVVFLYFEDGAWNAGNNYNTSEEANVTTRFITGGPHTDCPPTAQQWHEWDGTDWQQQVTVTLYDQPDETVDWEPGAGRCSGAEEVMSNTNITTDVDCWHACLREVDGTVAIEWWAGLDPQTWYAPDSCVCKTECTCMDRAGDINIHLISNKSSLLDLPNECATPTPVPGDCPAAVELSGTAAYTGIFVKTNFSKGYRPVYINSNNYYLYYWEEYGSWRVGSDHTDATGNVDSGSGVYADCPPDTGTWYEWRLNQWMQRVEVTLYDRPDGTVEWLPGTGICTSASSLEGTADHVVDCAEWCYPQLAAQLVAVNWQRSTGTCFCRTECQCVDEVGVLDHYTITIEALTKPSLCGVSLAPTASPTAGLHDCPPVVVLAGMEQWHPPALTFVKSGMVQHSRPVYVNHVRSNGQSSCDPVFDDVFLYFESGSWNAGNCAMSTTSTTTALGCDGDGFELAMRFSSSSQFVYNSTFWTNDQLLDADDPTPSKDADGKFAPFTNVVASQIKGCLPNGCMTYTLATPQTLLSLFSNTPSSSTANVQFGGETADDWAAAAGATGLQREWMDTGINYVDDQSEHHCRVRFGALFNNENSVLTANDAVGFGATEAFGAMVGAGWTRANNEAHPTQGTIWLSSSGGNCAMSTTSTTTVLGCDGDGFELAMRFSSSSQFDYNSAYWTNVRLLDADDPTPSKDADGKFAAFTNVVASQIKGCLPNGCMTYTLATPQTLQSLFSNTPSSSTANVQFGGETADDWAAAAGATGLQTEWMDTGINYVDDQSGYDCRVRFGALFNNENSVITANDAVGFGATEAYGAMVGAGWTRANNEAHPTQGTIWVSSSGGRQNCSSDTAIVTTRFVEDRPHADCPPIAHRWDEWNGTHWQRIVNATVYDQPDETIDWEPGVGSCAGSAEVLLDSPVESDVHCWHACLREVDGTVATEWWAGDDPQAWYDPNTCVCKLECTCMDRVGDVNIHLITNITSLLDLPPACTAAPTEAPTAAPSEGLHDCSTAVDVTSSLDSSDYQGMFVKTAVVQNSRPVYINSRGYFLYYWSQYGSWRVGTNYSDATCFIDSGAYVYAACPPNSTLWYEWLFNDWRQRASVTLHDHPAGTTEFALGAGRCESHFNEYVGPTSTVVECWQKCIDFHGDVGVMAVDWYRDDGDCMCQSDCLCMEEVGEVDYGPYLLTNSAMLPVLPQACSYSAECPTAVEVGGGSGPSMGVFVKSNFSDGRPEYVNANDHYLWFSSRWEIANTSFGTSADVIFEGSDQMCPPESPPSPLGQQRNSSTGQRVPIVTVKHHQQPPGTIAWGMFVGTCTGRGEPALSSTTTIVECWGTCKDQVSGVVAVNWYWDSTCYCVVNCTCLDEVGIVDGHLLTESNFQLPDGCTPAPTVAPTAAPPTSAPTTSPSPEATASPTTSPSLEPTTWALTTSPSLEATALPTTSPSPEATASPTTSPSLEPTTWALTTSPSLEATALPTPQATASPTTSPSLEPTVAPTTWAPTTSTSLEPTVAPTFLGPSPAPAVTQHEVVVSGRHVFRHSRASTFCNDSVLIAAYKESLTASLVAAENTESRATLHSCQAFAEEPVARRLEGGNASSNLSWVMTEYEVVLVSTGIEDTLASAAWDLAASLEDCSGFETALSGSVEEALASTNEELSVTDCSAAVSVPAPTAAPTVAFLWIVGPWGPCSTLCGSGSRSRDVHCDGGVGSQVVPDTSCSTPPPETTQACFTEEGCATEDDQAAIGVSLLLVGVLCCGCCCCGRFLWRLKHPPTQGFVTHKTREGESFKREWTIEMPNKDAEGLEHATNKTRIIWKLSEKDVDRYRQVSDAITAAEDPEDQATPRSHTAEEAADLGAIVPAAPEAAPRRFASFNAMDLWHHANSGDFNNSIFQAMEDHHVGAYENGDRAEYLSSTLGKWLPAVMQVVGRSHDESHPELDLQYNARVGMYAQPRHDVPLQSLRRPFNHGEPCSFYCKEVGKWLPAYALTGPKVCSSALFGYTIAEIEETQQNSFTPVQVDDEVASPAVTSIHIRRAPAHLLRRRFPPRSPVEVYRGPFDGWAAAAVLDEGPLRLRDGENSDVVHCESWRPVRSSTFTTLRGLDAEKSSRPKPPGPPKKPSAKDTLAASSSALRTPAADQNSAAPQPPEHATLAQVLGERWTSVSVLPPDAPDGTQPRFVESCMLRFQEHYLEEMACWIDERTRHLLVDEALELLKTEQRQEAEIEHNCVVEHCPRVVSCEPDTNVQCRPPLLFL